MTKKIYSKAIDKSIDVGRVIGSIKGKENGPTIIFSGGIHGNEPSGVFALHQVMQELAPLKDNVRGNIFAISGNLWALERQERFEKDDLNRLWTKDRMLKILEGKENELEQTADTTEQLEIYHVIESIIKEEEGPFFFIDLHTTSSDTIPFLTVNDTILNRKFSLQFPVPIILGIEEFLDGPLLSYINHLGYIAVGFESGQHDDPIAISNHVAFSYLVIQVAGCLSRDLIPNYDMHYRSLNEQVTGRSSIFEITHRHEVKEKDHFVMKTGYENFSSIKKGEVLAESNGEKLISDRNARIFMPLYQKQGNDGYFIIRKTPRFFLQMSKVLRRVRFDRVIALLPGVRWETKSRETLIISLRTAKFFAKEFLHLLGYRSRMIDETHMYAKNRERASREQEYKKMKWF